MLHFIRVRRVDGQLVSLPHLPFPADVEELEGALCAEVDPELWFPEEGGSPEAARAICARCPVQEACLQQALRNREPYGVWGGLTPRERQNLRRRRERSGQEAA